MLCRGALVLALVALTTPAAAGQPASLRVSSHRVAWPGLRRAVRVAQLSDLHVGRYTPTSILEAAAARARAARPQLVVLTGDYLNRNLEYAPALARYVASLPRPCLAVLGNHDHWSGAAGVRAALRRAGARVLSNAAERVRGAGWELTVVGIDDGYTGHHAIRSAFASVARPAEALVITHYPPLADAIARLEGRLILAGHSHGENRPGLRYHAGWYRIGAARLYVNAGLGSGRKRGRAPGDPTRPELALFELVPAPAASAPAVHNRD
jgi:predicted MPP superfamily phosphohydrolase